MIDWKSIQRQRGIFERRYNRLFRIALNKLAQPLLDAINNNEFTSADEVDMSLDLVHLDENIIRDVYNKMYTEVGLHWIKDSDMLIQKDMFTSEDWGRLIMSTIEGEVANRIVSVVSSSKKMIKRQIKKEISIGMEKGESIREITRRIKRVVPIGVRKYNKFNALRIALTEVGTVQSQASFIGAKQMGLDLIKIWNTAPVGFARDERHNKMGVNGQERRMDEYFDVGGEMLRFPGDPNGSPENTINCNCVMTYKTAV